MREILNGAIDLHVHAGPSVAKREVDAAEMLKEAVSYGYRAFVVKDHYFPTMMSAALVEKHLGDNKVKVFGGIALNNSVGGINLKAVDTAYAMGAKFVWMPTVSAKNHIDGHKGHFAGSGTSAIAEQPIVYIDKKGNLLEPVKNLLQFVAARPDLVLATGHGSAQEIDVLIHEAAAAGVQKIMVNHPFYLINASMEQITEWGKLGAYIELNACVFKPSKFGVISLDTAVKVMENVALDHILLDSDYGQNGNGSVAEGLGKFIERLMNEASVSEQQINIMLKENPAKLLGL